MTRSSADGRLGCVELGGDTMLKRRVEDEFERALEAFNHPDFAFSCFGWVAPPK